MSIFCFYFNPYVFCIFGVFYNLFREPYAQNFLSRCHFNTPLCFYVYIIFLLTENVNGNLCGKTAANFTISAKNGAGTSVLTP